MTTPWLTIDSAPRDGTPIVGWCNHEADPYWAESLGAARSLTIYGGHVEGLSHVENGPHVLVWGGGWSDCVDDGGGWMPDWWFQRGTEFEVAANPTHWMSIPDGPDAPVQS